MRFPASCVLLLLTLVPQLSLATGPAADNDPTCLAQGKDLPQNNDQIVQWKKSTPNQFLARGHATGTVSQLYPDKNGHQHFEIRLDTAAGDTLEIVYSDAFGAIPKIQAGMSVEACGDYITSTQATGQYSASPDGAILHWIHKSPKPNGHPSGYVEVDNVVYGGD